MIQEIVGIQFAFGQKPKSFYQNGLLGNRSGNSKKSEKLGLEKFSIDRFVNQGNIKA